MNRPIVWFLLGVLAMWLYTTQVAKIPSMSMKPGNGG